MLITFSGKELFLLEELDFFFLEELEDPLTDELEVLFLDELETFFSEELDETFLLDEELDEDVDVAMLVEEYATMFIPLRTGWGSFPMFCTQHLPSIKLSV